MKGRRIIEIALFVLIVATSIAVFVFKNSLQQLGEWGYIGVFLLCFLSNLTVFLPAPSLLVVVSCSQVLSPFFVALVGAIGTTMGEMSGYVSGALGQDLSTKFKGLVQKMAKRVKNNSIAVAVFALLPLPLFDVAGVYAGGVRMPVASFAISCFLGKWLKMLAYAYMAGRLLEFLV